jgi:Ni/Fe-hydrogenase subunit HybB-like protein
MRDYASWGIYISNFVFFVAISLVGSLITAIFRLASVEWRTPLTRISEIIAVSAILFASIIIIVDMGRPERFTHLFLYGSIAIAYHVGCHCDHYLSYYQRIVSLFSAVARFAHLNQE